MLNINKENTFSTEFIENVITKLVDEKNKEIKNKIKFAAWLMRQTMKLKDVEDYLDSQIVDLDLCNEKGVVIGKKSAFVAINKETGELLCANLLKPEFALKLRNELLNNRLKAACKR